MAFAFVLPITGAWVPLPQTTAIALLLLIAYHRKPRIAWRTLWPIAALYALHLLALAWTQNLEAGLTDAQVKLGLLLLPLAMAAVSTVRKHALREGMIAFTLGCLAAIGFGLAKAWQCAQEGGAGCYTQSALSYDVHPSYAAWYACWCVAYWGHALLHGTVGSRRMRWAALIAMLSLAVFTLMLASKSGVFSLALVLAWLGVLMLRRLQGKARALALGASVLIALSAVWLFGGVAKERIAAAVNAVQLAGASDEALLQSSDGNALRLVAWSCSADVLKEAPWGVGPGDARDHLVSCYSAKEAAPALERRLNSHSQLMQEGVGLGWPGLLLAVAMVLLPLFSALRDRHALLAIFVLMLLANMAVESVFELQAGVAFVGMMLGLLLHPQDESAKTIEP